MIIKKADDKSHDIQTLNALLTRPGIPEQTRKNIEREIRNIKAGDKGEQEAAYEIGFHYADSKNWVVLHDLRFECEGRVAQIDHLLINRFLDIWVCESKHFSEGIAINEQGECSTYFKGRPNGIPSPIEQNKKHVEILHGVLKTGVINLPSRLGFTITPTINSMILISKGARISRPKGKIDGIDSIIKNDQLKSKIDKELDSSNNPLLLAKLVGTDTLETFARQLAALHKPIAFNWAGKFGLNKDISPDPKRDALKAPAIGVNHTTSDESQKSKLICAACGNKTSYNIARFCWNNKARFNGNVFCMDCQPQIMASQQAHIESKRASGTLPQPGKF